jgi:hypothetical protein
MSTYALDSQSSAYGRAALWLAVALALAALWVGGSVLLPDISDSGWAAGIRSTVTRLILHAIMLGGLWLALSRTALDAPARIAVWAALAVPFTLWLAAAWGLALTGAFQARPGVPALPLAILLPLILALPPLMRSRRIAEVLDATPPSWLVAVQIYRIFGGVFLAAWSRGEISAVFALPAGSGDVLVGVLALPVAALLAAGARGARQAAIAWNVLGLIDFAIAVGIGFLSAPGPLQLIVPDRPNLALGTFPTVMIPVFAVPSSILLHALSLRQLLRRPAAAAR